MSGLTRQVEHQDWQIENTNAGDDQVDDVEQRFSSYFQVEKYV